MQSCCLTQHSPSSSVRPFVARRAIQQNPAQPRLCIYVKAVQPNRRVKRQPLLAPLLASIAKTPMEAEKDEPAEDDPFTTPGIASDFTSIRSVEEVMGAGETEPSEGTLEYVTVTGLTVRPVDPPTPRLCIAFKLYYCQSDMHRTDGLERVVYAA